MSVSLKKTIPIALVFILSCTIIIKVIDIADCSCAALNTYIPFDFGYSFYSLVIMALTFILGLVVYLFIKKKHTTNTLFKYFYWALLPVIVLIRPLLSLENKLPHRNIKQSICSKSIGAGITAKSKNLNLKEYNYLRSQYSLFPDLPITAKNIDINYYVDDFLGDFSLDVSLNYNSNEKFKFNKNWTISNSNKPNLSQHIVYHDSRQ